MIIKLARVRWALGGWRYYIYIYIVYGVAD